MSLKLLRTRNLIGNRFSTLRPIYHFLLIGLLDLVILIPQAKLDPDPHHDGVMFAAAVGVAEGKIPNRDVFAQYGPLPPILQAQVLKVFGFNLLNLRIATGILLTVTAILVFIFLRNQIGFKYAFLIQLLWVMSYPKLPLPPLMPWASVICTLLILISLYCWKSASSNNLQGLRAKVLLFASGFTVSLAIFARIQLLFFVFAISCILVAQLFKSKNRKPETIYFLFGSLFMTLVSLSWLIQNSALQDFVQQCISWPRKFYGESYLPTTIFTKDGFIYWATWYYYPLFYLVLVFYMRNFKSRSGKIQIQPKFQILASWLFAFIMALTFVVLSTLEVKNKSYLNPLLQGQWIIEKMPLSLFYLTATLGFMKIFVYLNPKNKECDFFEILIIAAAIAQLYPGSDPIHLWWITPILLVTVLPRFIKSEFSTTIEARKFSFLLIFFVLISILNLVQFQSKDRVEFPRDSILVGMQAPVDEARFVGKSLELIASLSTNNDILFDCSDGLYAVAGGRYLAKDKYFVNWGPDHVIQSTDYSIIFVCRMSKNEMLAKYPSDGYQILNRISSLSGRENYILRVRKVY